MWINRFIRIQRSWPGAIVLLLLGLSAAAADDRALCNSKTAPNDDSIAACNRIIGSGQLRGSDLAGRYVDRGIHLRRKGEPDHALADYNQAIALDSRLAIAYLSRGNIFLDKRETDRALADFDKAIGLAGKSDPNLSLMHLNRGNAWRTKGEAPRALSDYETAIRLFDNRDANLAFAYYGRGEIWRARKEWDRALADFDKAIALNTKYALAYVSRGQVWVGRGDYGRALVEYDRAVAVDPSYVDGYVSRGAAWRLKDNLERALADLDQAIALNPRNPVAYSERGYLWHAKSIADRKNGDAVRAGADAEQAMQDFDKAINLNPRYDGTYNNRGNVRNARGDLDGALADYSTAINLNPGNAVAYANRATVRRRKGDLDGAIADGTAAIRLDPGFTAALTNRGQAYESKGNREAARADYMQALAGPAKYDTGKGAQDTARARLAVLGAGGPAAPVTAARAPSSGDGRIALVVGNGAYPAAKLDNAPNDARAVAKALRDIGFDVIEGIDLDHTGMRRVLTDFLLKAPSASVALVFYAGHGIQLNNKNYLAPIDARLLSETTVDLELINVDQQILAGLSDESRINIVILDACRDNPFANAGKRSGRGGTGLARSPSRGALIVYSTDPDNVADDGDGLHSPFTTALLKYISDPTLEIVAMLRKVQLEVQRATKRAQNPYLDLPPLGEVYLARSPKRAAAN